MPNAKIDRDDSQSHLEAMLYVLQDPALDRTAFEARLEEDCRLGEILAEAVALFEMTQKMDSWQPGSAASPNATFQSSDPAPSLVPAEPPASTRSGWRWVASLCAIAATLLVVLARWDGFPSRDADAASTQDVVLAWGAMQTDRIHIAMDRESVEWESEWNLASLDSVEEPDVPEWIVLATSDRLDRGLDARDGKGMLQ